MTDREELQTEIDALSRLIVSNRAALMLQKLSAADRQLLVQQSNHRTASLEVLRLRMAALAP